MQFDDCTAEINPYVDKIKILSNFVECLCANCSFFIERDNVNNVNSNLSRIMRKKAVFWPKSLYNRMVTPTTDSH